MATTALVVTDVSSRWPTAGTEFAYVAGDASNGNHIAEYVGREVILAYNSSTDTNYDLTITGVADRYGRSANIVEEIPFGEYRALYLANEGWRDSATRKVLVTVENAAVKLAVLRLPAS